MAAKASCRCDCGYTCDRRCGLPIMECMDKHYHHECDHKFNGPTETLNEGMVKTATCSKCGTTAFGHDMMVGP